MARARGAQVITRATGSRQEGIAVTDERPRVVSSRQDLRGAVVRQHLREFEDGVQLGMVHECFGRTFELECETRPQRKTFRIKQRREVILVGRDNAKRITSRTDRKSTRLNS